MSAKPISLVTVDAPPKRRPRRVQSSEVWLSPKEAAAHLGLSVNVIYAACTSKGLRHAKLGHSTIRIRREWLDAWAEAFATE